MSPPVTRHHIDEAFASWGRFVHQRRFGVLVLSLLLVATFASFLPQMRSENSLESYLHGDDPTSEIYEEFQRQFGQDDQILVAVRAPEVFDLAFLKSLRALHADLASEVPHLTDVTSLVNARQTRGEGDTLVVGELFPRWDEHGGDPADLRRRVASNPLFVDQLISRDGRVTAVILEPSIYSSRVESDALGAALEGFEAEEPDSASLELLTEVERRELVHALDRVVERYDAPGFEIHVAGGTVLGVKMTEQMTSDAASYMSVAALAIAGFLFLLFRRFSGVVFPLAVVLAALVGNLGTMVWLDIPFSLTLAMLPVFTMCVGVCNAVHVLVLVYRSLAEGASREDALAYAFGHSGLAILMTSLTTAAGMFAFSTASIDPIRHLGITAPFGVLYAFVFSVTLLPALVAVFPPRRGVGQREGTPRIERLLVFTGDFSVRYARSVLAVGTLLLALAVFGTTRVQLGHDPISWFDESHPFRQAVELVDSAMRGGTTTEVRVETGRENGLHEPENLARIEAAMRAAERLERGRVFVGKAISLVDVVKETHQALNGNDPAYYAVPGERDLVAQELLLFENSGSDDLEPLTDSQFRAARITLRVPMVDAVQYRDFLGELEGVLASALGPDLAFTLTGQTVIQARTFTALGESLARSYGVALLVITPLMVFLIRNLRLGLVSMLPNLFPVLATLGLMGLVGAKLDTSTVMIGSMIIGLAVDDTIHFLHRFRREFERSGDTRAAVRETMATTGSALFFTTLVLATGFAVLGSLGTLSNTIAFGWLSAFGISVAFLADAFLTPALIALVMRGQSTDRI